MRSTKEQEKENRMEKKRRKKTYRLDAAMDTMRPLEPDVEPTEMTINDFSSKAYMSYFMYRSWACDTTGNTGLSALLVGIKELRWQRSGNVVYPKRYTTGS
jgi:hypothetical protein